MKKYFSIVLFFICSYFSCSENTPEGILKKNEMVSVLINIHLAEAKANNSFLNSDTLKIFYQSLEDTVFARHHTSKKTFEQSFQYYMANPSIMEKIYTQVVDSLSLREAIKNIN